MTKQQTEVSGKPAEDFIRFVLERPFQRIASDFTRGLSSELDC
jgi:hypothetical protein